MPICYHCGEEHHQLFHCNECGHDYCSIHILGSRRHRSGKYRFDRAQLTSKDDGDPGFTPF